MKKLFCKSITLVITLVMLFSAFSLAGCWEDAGDEVIDYGVKPADLDDPMPELWEEVIEGAEFDYSSIDPKTVTEITIGKDVTRIDPFQLATCSNLENIYVEDGNQAFVSDKGVLYSKSYQTLHKWPEKKKVTKVRDTVKYFVPLCFCRCDLPKNFELPDGTISIGDEAFGGSNLTKLHIKKNVQTVGNRIYAKCTQIEISAPIVYQNFFRINYEATIIFNEGVRQIRTNKSGSFYQLKAVKFPSTLEAIGNVRFAVHSRVAKYTLPKSIAFLDEYAFDDYAFPTIPYDTEAVDPEAFIPDFIPREVTTAFDCKSDYAQSYIDAKLPVWERVLKNKK